MREKKKDLIENREEKKKRRKEEKKKRRKEEKKKRRKEEKNKRIKELKKINMNLPSVEERYEQIQQHFHVAEIVWRQI